MITILFIGDVVGEPGRTAVKHMLPELKREHGADFIIVNGENAAAGRGITPVWHTNCCTPEWMSSQRETMSGTRRSWPRGWNPNRGCCVPSTIRREHRGTGA